MMDKGRGIQSVSGRRIVTTAWAAMPSPRPVKPRRSVVVAFTLTERSSTCKSAATFRRTASRYGPNFGASQISVASRWSMIPPRAVIRSRARRQEPRRGSALPLRIAGREVTADVAVRDRAEQRVGDRVEQDVGVAMTGKRGDMRHPDPAEPDMIARRKGVDVEPRADAVIIGPGAAPVPQRPAKRQVPADR
jgi:hypothetical protein